MIQLYVPLDLNALRTSPSSRLLLVSQVLISRLEVSITARWAPFPPIRHVDGVAASALPTSQTGLSRRCHFAVAAAVQTGRGALAM